MLATSFIILRFCHFTALLLMLGCAICGALLAPSALRTVVMKRLSPVWFPGAALCALSALLLWAVQGGMMGDGWPDVFSPAIWLRLLQSHFGAVWLWQIIFASVALAIALIKPRGLSALLLILALGQVALLGRTGHAAVSEGVAGVASQVSYALHLLAAGWWFGGLIPLLVCMALATRARWHQPATVAMMRFSRYGHLAVALVIATGIINLLLITGFHWPSPTRYRTLLLVKVALVMVMVTLALINRYILVPHFASKHNAASRLFVMLTGAEIALSVAVLALVSLFATLDPY